MSTEPHWLVKDFNVLYRAAKRLAEAVDEETLVTATPFNALQDLKAQLERLAPAYNVTEAERAAPRNGG